MTPLNTAGQSRARPGSVLSAARRIGDATAARNGRATMTPAIVVPDATAAAVESRRQRALQRLIDPLLEAGGGGGEDGDMSPETTAFNNLATSAQLPKHPPLSMLLRDEDAGANLRSLPRFGGARGAHRALPAYKALAREKLRVASAVQQRATGAARLHAMLRAYASCFSSLLFSAYRTGIVSDALLVASDNASIYKLLVNVFSLPAIRHHCRTVELAADLRAVKASSLHVHFVHASMLSNLTDSASTTLMGADTEAASGAGVRELLSAKARLQRRDSRALARQGNTVAAAVAACGAVPSPAALEALRCHAESVVISFGEQVSALPAPYGASMGEATEAVLAVALALGLKRGLRLGDLQGLTFAALEPAVRTCAAGRPARHQHYLLSFKGSAGKTAAGSQSGFEDGAADPISKELHRALEQLYGWLSPVSTPFAAAAVPLLPDVSLLFAAASDAPPELRAPVASHRALLAGSSVAADAAALWLTDRYVATPLRPVPDAPLLAALRAATSGSTPVWTISRWPALRDTSWRWLRRFTLTARAAAWATKRAFCGTTIDARTAGAAAVAIAADAGTSIAQLHSHYIIGTFPRRALVDTCKESSESESEEESASNDQQPGASCSKASWCGRHTYFE